MKSIAEISEEWKRTEVEDMSAFIAAYAQDERGGVRALVQRAEKLLAAQAKELKRINQMYAFEREYGGYGCIAGVDEVGRGPLAGPVVTAAVVLPKDHPIFYLNDSKQLSAAKREALFETILREAVSVGIGIRDHNRIDEINILQATLEAMHEAVMNLSVRPDILLNDAVTIPHLPMRQVPIVKGDAKSASIAAASIVAKVTRDRMMVEADQLYPGYGFAENKGYGSAQHIKALQTLGATPIHRRSFITHFV